MPLGEEAFSGFIIHGLVLSALSAHAGAPRFSDVHALYPELSEQALRIAHTLQLEQGNAFSPKYFLLPLQIKLRYADYLARPRWQGNVSFNLGEKGEEKALKDMGLLPARSANDLLAYRKALAGPVKLAGATNWDVVINHAARSKALT